MSVHTFLTILPRPDFSTGRHHFTCAKKENVFFRSGNDGFVLKWKLSLELDGHAYQFLGFGCFYKCEDRT